MHAFNAMTLMVTSYTFKIVRNDHTTPFTDTSLPHKHSPPPAKHNALRSRTPTIPGMPNANANPYTIPARPSNPVSRTGPTTELNKPPKPRLPSSNRNLANKSWHNHQPRSLAELVHMPVAYNSQSPPPGSTPNQDHYKST